VINGATGVGDAVLVAVALLGGYLVGSIPTARIVGAGTGSGWVFLALTIDLAKGIIPVAIGLVTWSWWIGWAAGLGAVIGACWPAFGRARGGHGLATLAGAACTLGPPAGVLSGVLGLLVLGIGRLAGRDLRAGAVAVGLGVFPALFLAVEQDAARLAACVALYVVVLVRARTTPDR
jgi:glycerol-3-phosphate acyltransferase PlsY